MTRLTHLVFLTALAMTTAVAPTTTAAAWAQSTTAPRPEPAWQITFALNNSSSRAGEGLGDAFRGAGLSATFSLWGPPVTYPRANDGWYGQEVALSRRLGRRSGVSVVWTSADLGGGTGSAGLFQTVNIWFKARMVAASYEWRPSKHVRLGAGPVLARTEVRSGGSTASSWVSTTAGAAATLAVETGVSRWGVAGASATYRRLLAVDAGPFATEGFLAPRLSMPAQRINLSHAAIGLHLGVRF